MSVRFTNDIMSRQTLFDLGNITQTLTKTQNELSTGKSISTPEDNPYGAGLATSLKNELADNQQYQSNISDAQAWTQTADATLGNVTDIIQRARELVVAAANGTQDQTSLSAISAEITQLKGSLQAQANATYNGRYIFAGTATNTEPYPGNTYTGNSLPVQRLVGAGQTVAINQNGPSAFGVTAAGPPATKNVFDMFDDVINDLNTGNTAALGSTALAGMDAALTTADQRAHDGGGDLESARHAEQPADRAGAVDLERPLEHAGCRHGQGHDHVLTDTDRLPGGLAGRREDHPADPARLPQLMHETPEGPMVKIESTRFGTIEVPEDTILTFPAGMIGFGDLHRYSIVKQREDSVFLWLQSVDDPALAFPIVLPWVFYWDYEVQLSDEDMRILDVERADQISIYCVVRVTANVREATINLFSPVVVNNAERTARQILNAVEGYSTRDPLFRSDDGPTPVSMREDESPNVVLLGRD